MKLMKRRRRWVCFIIFEVFNALMKRCENLHQSPFTTSSLLTVPLTSFLFTSFSPALIEWSWNCLCSMSMTVSNSLLSVVQTTFVCAYVYVDKDGKVRDLTEEEKVGIKTEQDNLIALVSNHFNKLLDQLPEKGIFQGFCADKVRLHVKK